MPTLDGYSVASQLASDPLSELWRGQDLKSGDNVAIRFITTTSLEPPDRKALHRHLEETAAMAALIKHPNVVSVRAYGIRGGEQPYVVVDLVDGTTCAAGLTAERRELHEAARIGEAVARGLAAGHDIGLAHGDVRPDNLLRGNDGSVKLTEFGVAQLLEHALAKHRQFLRTPAYLAPEVLAGGPATPSSDIFSLGTTVYALVTGVAPFARGSRVETAAAVRDHRPALASLLRPDITHEWDKLLEHAMEKEPKARIATAAELADRFAALAKETDAGHALDASGNGDLTDDERTLALTDTMTFERPVIVGGDPLLTDELGACEEMLQHEAAHRLQVRVIGGPITGRQFPVTGTLFFGRVRAQVTLDDTQVSRRHARLDLNADGTATLTDLGSTNGTYVGRTLIKSVELKEGSEFQIGESLFRLEVVAS